MRIFLLFLPFVTLALQGCSSSNTRDNTTSNNSTFELVTDAQKATIVYDKKGPALDSISAYLLAEDIERVTGYLPQVTTDLNSVSGNAIILGNQNSALLQTLLPSDVYRDTDWETYTIQLRENPMPKLQKALLIAGTDARGTTYGVFSISEKIGVSPWYWWADATPQKQDKLLLEIEPFQSKSPAVQYRGIFINDEDWGLQPWAAKTLEPETGDIGPKTYAKAFELLLRLKANAIWPAMHPSTKAFFHYPGNLKMAEDFQIVLGSSHAEPMLRNNVDEWNHETMGDFNYVTNKEQVLNYWEDRVVEAQQANGIYTVGMRGVHDSGMAGAKSTADAANILNQVISDQRELLQKHIGKPEEIPQVFTIYKEVLDVYEYGLELPEDITLMWTDDNYGYIRRLSNAEERKRSGGSGVYYHASYWGRPHDYLWLSTTHPALIREEMLKAYDTGADKIWILNVGDIKPAEYNMQFFMDLAFEPEQFRKPDAYQNHMQQFYGSIFGAEQGTQISKLRASYYDLAWLRKPEFMGWSQTEPTRPTHLTEFSINEENPARLKAYDLLETETAQLANQIPAGQKDAFFQLVAYPVLGAAAMNKKFLYRDLANASGKNDQVQKQYADSIAFYHDKIENLTKQYNTHIASGKWNHIMHPAPRNLPVYSLPETILNDEQLVEQIPAPLWVRNAADFDAKSHFENGYPEVLTGLGYSKKVLKLAPSTAESESDSLFDGQPQLQYNFNLEHKLSEAHLLITAVPTHPITGNQKLRLCVQIDDQPIELINIETYGRSEEWKVNVLRNQARKIIKLNNLGSGDHSLRLFVIDPGVLPDYLMISEKSDSFPYTHSQYLN